MLGQGENTRTSSRSTKKKGVGGRAGGRLARVSWARRHPTRPRACLLSVTQFGWSLHPGLPKRRPRGRLTRSQSRRHPRLARQRSPLRSTLRRCRGRRAHVTRLCRHAASLARGWGGRDGGHSRGSEPPPPAGARRDWAETGVGRAGRRVEPRLKRRPRAAASPLRQGTAGTAPRRHRWSTPRVARPACHGRTAPRTGVGGGGRDTSVPRTGAAPPFVTRVWAAGHCCDKRRIGAGSPVSRIADVRIVLCSGGSYGPSYGPTIPGACATRRPRCAWPSLFLVGTQRADHPQAVADPSTGTLPPRGGRKRGGGGCKEREGAAGALPARARLAMTARSGVATLAFLCSQPSRTLPPPSTFNLPSIHARGARTSLPPGSDAWAMMVSKGGRQRGRQAATLVGSPNRGGGHGQRPRGGPPAPAAAPAAPKAPCRRRCRRRCNGERKVFRRPPPPPPEAPAIGEPAPPPSSQSPVAWPAAVRTSAAAAVLGAALAPSTPLTYHNDE